MTENLNEKQKTERPRTPVYFMNVPCKNEMEIIQALIYQYSVSLFLRGKVTIPLRKKLVILLSLYFKFGYNNETKEMAVEMFNCEKESLNSENHELSRRGYLIDDPISKRKKHLNKELQDLLEYWSQSSERDERLMIVKLFLEE